MMREDIQLYNAALNCAHVGQWQSAIVNLDEAIALEADEAEYHSLLAVAYLGCRAKGIPLAQISRTGDAVKSDSAIYQKLAKQSLYSAFLIDPGDPLLNSYLPWLFGTLSDDDYPAPPDPDRPNPDRPPKPSPPNLPTGETAASFVDAEAIGQVP